MIFNPLSISIHTPTKGATSDSIIVRRAGIISIHTPTKGATFITLFRYQQTTHFNPHSHEGSDTGKVPIYCGNFISIHTPTKGATAILTNNFLIFCSISLINFILYLQIIQILFIFRYKFIFYFIF